MKIRALLGALAKVSAFTVGIGACGGAPGKLMVDTPLLPYQAPDISEITGIEEPDSDSESGSAAEPAK